MKSSNAYLFENFRQINRLIFWKNQKSPNFRQINVEIRVKFESDKQVLNFSVKTIESKELLQSTKLTMSDKEIQAAIGVHDLMGQARHDLDQIIDNSAELEQLTVQTNVIIQQINAFPNAAVVSVNDEEFIATFQPLDASNEVSAHDSIEEDNDDDEEWEDIEDEEFDTPAESDVLEIIEHRVVDGKFLKQPV